MKVGPVVVSKRWDYAAPSMRKAEKKEGERVWGREDGKWEDRALMRRLSINTPRKRALNSERFACLTSV